MTNADGSCKMQIGNNTVDKLKMKEILSDWMDCKNIRRYAERVRKEIIW